MIQWFSCVHTGLHLSCIYSKNKSQKSALLRIFGVIWKSHILALGMWQVAQMVKCLPAMQETWVQSLGWEDPLEKAMAPHSSTLAWKIPWWRSLVGSSPWGRKESDTTDFTFTFTFRNVTLAQYKNKSHNRTIQFWGRLRWVIQQRPENHTSCLL